MIGGGGSAADESAFDRSGDQRELPFDPQLGRPRERVHVRVESAACVSDAVSSVSTAGRDDQLSTTRRPSHMGGIVPHDAC